MDRCLIDISKKENDYQRWALDFFTNPQLAPNPYVDITVQLDISTPSAIALEELSYASGGQTSSQFLRPLCFRPFASKLSSTLAR